MIPKTLRSLSVVISVVVAIALSGCSGGGGSGGTGMTGGSGGTGMTELDAAKAEVTRLEGELAAAPTDADVAAVQTIDLMPGPGLTLSNAAPVFAPDETSKLQATLANAASGVPVLSATLSRTFGVSRSSQLTKDFYVKTIRTDGNGAYVIGYVLDGTEAEVTIPASACVSEAGDCEVTVDGRSYLLWSWTAGPGPYDPFAHEEFQYMDSFNLLISGLDGHNPRIWFVFGARTENLPMGGATFNGRFRARSYETANPANTRRQQYSGNMRLVANFDMSQLDGRIYRILGSQPGQNSRTRWPTSSFTITNGQIKNGQFTATLTGIDSDPNAPFDTSVRDVMGHILGEFYGPNAEEVGGVVTATRDVAGTQNDRVFFGFVGGRKVERVIAIDNTEVLVTAVYRDFDASSTAPFAVDMPTVEATEDVLRITYVVDGQTEIIEVRESDFGAYPGSPYTYYKRVGDTSGWLWSLTGSFIGPRDFDHFDINGWTRESHDANNLDVVASSVAGFAVYGTRTTNMPTTGTASYEGHMGAVEFPSDDAVFTDSAQANMYQGDVGLMANFTSSTVTGNVTNLESRPGNTGTYVSAIGGLNFNATINGNALTASDLAGTGALARYSNGSVKGAFYGPDAAEVGGVFNAADGANNRLLNGWFGGKKQ
jgi:hypothetical protein